MHVYLCPQPSLFFVGIFAKSIAFNRTNAPLINFAMSLDFEFGAQMRPDDFDFLIKTFSGWSASPSAVCVLCVTSTYELVS
jgi:hypothetical protein